jgi:hypothetical protein
MSAKASAALARRCLQAMLNEQGFKDKYLVNQVEKLLNAKVLPTHIHETVDAIRHFGNFGAHPINDKTSLQIIDVEPKEAEWCLEILEALFDHFYVQPPAAAAIRALLRGPWAPLRNPLCQLTAHSGCPGSGDWSLGWT